MNLVEQWARGENLQIASADQIKELSKLYLQIERENQMLTIKLLNVQNNYDDLMRDAVSDEEE